MTTIGHLINGQSIEANERTQDVFNPSNGEVSKQVALASKATVESAIEAAQAAYPAWRNTPAIKRARVMFKFKDLLEQNADKICQLIGEEHGKISHDAAGELQRGIENVEYACCAPELLKGEHSKNVAPNIDSWSEFPPWYLYGCIPWLSFAVTALFSNPQSETQARHYLLLRY